MANLLIDTDEFADYSFYPIPKDKDQLNFKVRAQCEAHLVLTTKREISDPMIEVRLGNEKSMIRSARVEEKDTPNLLNDNEFQGFWIKWSHGNYSLGKDGENEAFLVYNEVREIFSIKYFGIKKGAWRISIDDGATPGPAPVLCQSNLPPIWVAAADGEIPPNAVIGGFENEDLYIGRARHQYSLTPGKVMRTQGACFVAWGGAEHAISEYEVLCDVAGEFVSATGREIPPNALEAGTSETGETLFIGRVTIEENLVLGKVQPSHEVCYIPYDGQELPFRDYEVFCSSFAQREHRDRHRVSLRRMQEEYFVMN